MSFMVSGLNNTILDYAQNVTAVAVSMAHSPFASAAVDACDACCWGQNLASGQYSRSAVTFFADVDKAGRSAVCRILRMGTESRYCCTKYCDRGSGEVPFSYAQPVPGHKICLCRNRNG